MYRCIQIRPVKQSLVVIVCIYTYLVIVCIYIHTYNLHEYIYMYIFMQICIYIYRCCEGEACLECAPTFRSAYPCRGIYMQKRPVCIYKETYKYQKRPVGAEFSCQRDLSLDVAAPLHTYALQQVGCAYCVYAKSRVCAYVLWSVNQTFYSKRVVHAYTKCLVSYAYTFVLCISRCMHINVYAYTFVVCTSPLSYAYSLLHISQLLSAYPYKQTSVEYTHKTCPYTKHSPKHTKRGLYIRFDIRFNLHSCIEVCVCV